MIPANTADCKTSQKGTRLSSCIKELGIPDGFINVPNDWVLNLQSGTLDESYILTEIKEGRMVPFIGARNFSLNSEENVFKTYNTGEEVLVRRGLIKTMFTYDKGRAWHNAAYSHDHSGSQSCIFIYKTGTILVAESADQTEISGLRMSHQTTANFRDNDGQNPGETDIMLQLRDTDVYNSNVIAISESDLGFSFDDAFAGSLDSFIEVVGTPSATDTTIVVKVAPNANRSSYIAGITDFTVSDQIVSGAVYDPATNEVTITVDALTAGTKTISLGDASSVAAEVTGSLYSGSRLITVA